MDDDMIHKTPPAALGSTLYAFGQVSVCNRPIASSPADRPEGMSEFLCKRFRGRGVFWLQGDESGKRSASKMANPVAAIQSMGHRQGTPVLSLPDIRRVRRLRGQLPRPVLDVLRGGSARHGPFVPGRVAEDSMRLGCPVFRPMPCAGRQREDKRCGHSG